MGSGKHYYAFISHDTDDEKAAFWLRDKLEQYHIPTSIQKELTLEYKGIKKLKPCFVYQTDLAGGDLNKALGKELNDSQYLIIICSRKSAKSEYVNNEAKHFIESGQADRIIPYIIDGEPFADNEDDECFPPALRELTKGNLTISSWGCAHQTFKYDSHGNRTEENYYDTNDDYCLNLWGFAKKVAKYDERGKLTEEHFYGTNGKPIVALSNYSHCYIKYDEYGRVIETSYQDADGEPCLSVEGAAKKTVKYDKCGNIIETSYWGTDGKLCEAYIGCAHVFAKYDNRGNVIEKTYWDKDMEKTLNKMYYFKEVYYYDNNNDCVKVMYYDIEGNLAMTTTPVLENEYNDFGYPIRKCRYDANGNLLVEGIPILCITEDITDMNEYNTFIIVEWEKWKITDKLNLYLASLAGSNMIYNKTILVSDYSDEFFEKTIKGYENYQMDVMPVQAYEQLCDTYLQWKEEHE